jgi:hypothetical protein
MTRTVPEDALKDKKASKVVHSILMNEDNFDFNLIITSILLELYWNSC